MFDKSICRIYFVVVLECDWDVVCSFDESKVGFLAEICQFVLTITQLINHIGSSIVEENAENLNKLGRKFD